MTKEYEKAFKLLRKLHGATPHIDEVLRYLNVKIVAKKGKK